MIRKYHNHKPQTTNGHKITHTTKHRTLQTPTIGVTINKKSTTTEPPPQNGQQPKPPGGLNAFYWYQIFALDSAAVEVQEMFSSHRGHLTNTMNHHGETL